MDFKLNVMHKRLFVLSLLLVAIIFSLEMFLPFHALITVGYVIIIFYMLQFPEQSRYAIILGFITTMLIVLGYFLRAEEFKDEPSVALNRGLSVLAIWLAVYFSHRFKLLLNKEVKNKEQLNAVFNNATQGMLIVNKTGEIILVNPFAEKLLDYQKGELVGVNVENLLPSHLGSVHKHHRENFMAKPQDRPMGSGKELLAKRKDGSEFPVEISLSHFRNEEGAFAIAFIVDLTERKKAFEKINREHLVAQTYFELAPVLFVVLDKFGNVISINEYGCKLLGYAKQEVIGENWFEKFIGSDIRDEIFSYFETVLNAVDHTTIGRGYENPVLSKSGKEVLISWTNTVIDDTIDHSITVLAAGIDITERKRQETLAIAHHEAIQNLNDKLEVKIRSRTAELNEMVHKLESSNRELEKNQLLLKSIAHHFPDGVIGVLDKDLKYIFADGQELYNIGLHKTINSGERVFDEIHPALTRQAEDKLKMVFAGDRVTYDFEIDERVYTISAAPLPNEKNEINEIIIVIKNITDRKRVERDMVKSLEKEKELAEMKSKFVTMASHEFRTPLSTILSSAFLLENYSGEALEKSKGEYLSKIKRSVNNLTDLLNDFISLGKLDEGRIRVEYSEISIKEFLEELIPEMELVRKGNQTIRCEYSGEERLLLLDKQLLRSILLNLIGNAIKYSSKESEIKVKAAVTQHELVINVIDQGIGIPEDEHKNLFKRFYRARNAANIEGTGLGLNIIKKYVKLMHGKIGFQSKLLEGTTFTVTLPALHQVNKKL
jgi:PAS domain S-box-containing protein